MALIQASDRFFVAGARGMAGSAIVRALRRAGYGNPDLGGALLTPTRQELDLLDHSAVDSWMKMQRPDVVVLAAAKVGGIEANRSRPADFLLQNLRIETEVIEAAWRCHARRLLFLGSSCIYPKYAEQPTACTDASSQQESYASAERQQWQQRDASNAKPDATANSRTRTDAESDAKSTAADAKTVGQRTI